MFIRETQLDILKSSRPREFENHMLRLLAEEFPEHFEDGIEHNRERIRMLVERGNYLCIQDMRSLAYFLYLHYLLGDQFEDLEDTAWLTGLVEDRLRPASERLEIAFDGVTHVIGLREAESVN